MKKQQQIYVTHKMIHLWFDIDILPHTKNLYDIIYNYSTYFYHNKLHATYNL